MSADDEDAPSYLGEDGLIYAADGEIDEEASAELLDHDDEDGSNMDQDDEDDRPEWWCAHHGTAGNGPRDCPECRPAAEREAPDPDDPATIYDELEYLRQWRQRQRRHGGEPDPSAFADTYSRAAALYRQLARVEPPAAAARHRSDAAGAQATAVVWRRMALQPPDSAHTERIRAAALQVGMVARPTGGHTREWRQVDQVEHYDGGAAGDPEVRVTWADDWEAEPIPPNEPVDVRADLGVPVRR